jgi:tetratricopeptide (TPR) repeat protein
MAANRDAFAANRLDSWKEIAAFFGRAERTVKRWEAERGLPVHRLPGSGRSAVFAYSHELADWLRSRRQEIDSDREPSSRPEERAMPGPIRIEAVPAVAPPEPSTLRKASVSRRTVAWLASASVAAGLVVVFAIVRGELPLRSFAGHYSANAEAQELYLKGRYYWNRRTPEDLTRAIDYFTQAIVKDPTDAQAYVGLADGYNLLREFGAMSPSEAYPRALAAAQRAVELDQNSAEAHNSLAFPTFWWSWRGVTAEREFKRALQLNPDFVRGHHWYATYLVASHRHAEALVQIEQAQRLDPSSTAIVADKGYILWCAGRHDEGLALLRQLESSEPTFSSTRRYLGRIAWEQGDYAKAITEWKTDAELRHDENGLVMAEARAKGFASGGLHGLLESQLAVEKKLVDGGGGSAYELAATYAALDKKTEALAYLQIAFDRHEEGLLTQDPEIRTLRGDTVYQNLIARVSARLAQ